MLKLELQIDKGEPLMRRVPVLKLALQAARHVHVTSDESEVWHTPVVHYPMSRL